MPTSRKPNDLVESVMDEVAVSIAIGCRAGRLGDTMIATGQYYGCMDVTQNSHHVKRRGQGGTVFSA